MSGPASSAPVGVFDSGLGGLTVVAAIRARLPAESIRYVGDTARIPWGTKSPETVRRFAREIADHLVREGVKAVVVACNTASAVALPALRAALAVPVVGVVEPGAARAVAAGRSGRIGILATRGTIESGAYQAAVHRLAPEAVVSARAAPLLVPLVEEGILDGPLVDEALKRYAAPLLRAGIETLVLGCTHYPLLSGAIRRFVGPDVAVIDSAGAAADALAEALAGAGIQAEGGAGGLACAVTDAAESFRREGERFLGAPLGEVRVIESFA